MQRISGKLGLGSKMVQVGILAQVGAFWNNHLNHINNNQICTLVYRTLSKTYPKTARAHRIVGALDIFYAYTTMADASNRFRKLYS